jgi:hypothetical protein
MLQHLWRSTYRSALVLLLLVTAPVWMVGLVVWKLGEEE